MANIKFSAFTQKVVQTNVDFLVGYTGADNVRITPAALGDGIYLPLAGGTMTGNVKFNDNIELRLGNGSDLKAYHSGTNTMFDNNTGDLYITNKADDKDIIFRSDDGAGGVATYFYLDGSIVENRFTKATRHSDNIIAKFGDANDLNIYSNGSNSYIENFNNDLVISNTADDKDIKFFCDDGSGGVTPYITLDGSHTTTLIQKKMHFDDNIKLTFGDYATPDLEIYHDGSHSYIEDTGTGQLRLKSNSQIQFLSDTNDYHAKMVKDGTVELYYDNSLKLETTATGIQVTDEVSIGTSIIHTGDTDTKISFGTDEIVLTTAGADAVKVDSAGNVGIGTATPTGLLHLSGISQTGNKNPFKIDNDTNNNKFVISSISGDYKLQFKDAGNTIRVLLDSNGDSYLNGGNVGIGTTSPQSKLHVAGTQSYGSLKLTPTAANGESAMAFFLDTAGTQTSDAWVVGHAGWGNTGDFVIGNQQFGGPIMLMQQDGNVGIGTTGPTAALQVVGLVEYADNAAAITAGLTAGAFYRTGDLLKVVH